MSRHLTFMLEQIRQANGFVGTRAVDAASPTSERIAAAFSKTRRDTVDVDRIKNPKGKDSKKGPKSAPGTDKDPPGAIETIGLAALRQLGRDIPRDDRSFLGQLVGSAGRTLNSVEDAFRVDEALQRERFTAQITRRLNQATLEQREELTRRSQLDTLTDEEEIDIKADNAEDLAGIRSGNATDLAELRGRLNIERDEARFDRGEAAGSDSVAAIAELLRGRGEGDLASAIEADSDLLDRLPMSSLQGATTAETTERRLRTQARGRFDTANISAVREVNRLSSNEIDRTNPRVKAATENPDSLTSFLARSFNPTFEADSALAFGGDPVDPTRTTDGREVDPALTGDIGTLLGGFGFRQDRLEEFNTPDTGGRGPLRPGVDPDTGTPGIVPDSILNGLIERFEGEAADQADLMRLLREELLRQGFDPQVVADTLQ